MCISNNAYQAPRVDFKDTILFGGVVRTESGDIEHVLGYYNKVATLTGAPASGNDFGWDVAPNADDDFGYDIAPKPKRVGNAMLFCLPAKPGTLKGVENLIPVKDYPRFMEDYKRAVAPQEKSLTRSRSVSFSLGADSAPAPVVVKGFDGGTYDVIIAPGGPSQIAQVIGQVDEDKRPQLNDVLYSELAIAYPNFAAVLFCFSESDAEKAGCAVIRYTPMLPHLIFLPGLDGHNGYIERGEVELNHTLVLGTYDMKAGQGDQVRFTDDKLAHSAPGYGHGRRGTPGIGGGMGLTAPLPKAPYWLLPRVVGRVIDAGTTAPQGDFWAQVEDVKNGIFRVRRQVPPGWSKLSGSPADPANGQKYYITRTTQGANAK
jgi:hypothetical protein